MKIKCYLYVIITIRFLSVTICNLLIDLPSYLISRSICQDPENRIHYTDLGTSSKNGGSSFDS